MQTPKQQLSILTSGVFAAGAFVWLVKDTTLVRFDRRTHLPRMFATPGDVDANIQSSKRQPTLVIAAASQPIAADAFRARDHKPAAAAPRTALLAAPGPIFRRIPRLLGVERPGM